MNDPSSLPSNVKELYKLINKVERDVGGDAGIMGMSGSVARLSMDAILRSMELDSTSCLLDIGSGLGRPLLHGLVLGAAGVCGIEFDPIKHVKAQTLISRILPLEYQVRTCCYNLDVQQVQSLADLDERITHIFSFWQGINHEARATVGRLVTHSWLKTDNLRSVAVVQEFRKDMQAYMSKVNFPPELSLVDSFPVSMIGSAAKFRAYIFKFPKVNLKKQKHNVNLKDDRPVPQSSVVMTKQCLPIADGVAICPDEVPSSTSTNLRSPTGDFDSDDSFASTRSFRDCTSMTRHEPEMTDRVSPDSEPVSHMGILRRNSVSSILSEMSDCALLQLEQSVRF